jgi:tRNA G18 (ribose-2'-O)-methylase SpoU
MDAPAQASGGARAWPRQIAGERAILAALAEGAPIGLLLVSREDAHSAGLLALANLARERGIEVRLGAPREVERMSSVVPAASALALVGDPPRATLDELMRRDGAVWLLTGIAYGTNAGFAIRTAEVSGAAGAVVDVRGEATNAIRRTALRASIRADRFFPVLWERAKSAVAAARASGRRVIGVEDVGERAPWEADLTGRVLLIVGGEQAGIARDVLGDCDTVVRIPMHGFIPSYNLQAAVASIAIERLRQTATITQRS